MMVVQQIYRREKPPLIEEFVGNHPHETVTCWKRSALFDIDKKRQFNTQVELTAEHAARCTEQRWSLTVDPVGNVLPQTRGGAPNPWQIQSQVLVSTLDGVHPRTLSNENFSCPSGSWISKKNSRCFCLWNIEMAIIWVQTKNFWMSVTCQPPHPIHKPVHSVSVTP